ncbi:glycosyltransferase family 4 protein [Pelosinus sp. sgz500959]|uniref:glycosyltransferase family 4 protein n=1 Tax=Pelosinus sp. sgz500959 TaxID=3242472 RepID=UPI00366F53EB
MRVLFLHPNFPAQFRHLAANLASNPENQVIFGTMKQEGNMQGVQKAVYTTHRDVSNDTHRYVRPLEGAVIQAQGAYRMADQLKQQGFTPDVIFGHSGWGPTLFMKDVFPKTPFMGYFEWFYNAHGSDADFDTSTPSSSDDITKLRINNAPILIDLYSSDWGITPTFWQYQQFPKEYRNKITVLHDGIDTSYFQPKLGSRLVLPEQQLDLSHVDELITYVARGMEPYRGFPQFMEAVALVLERRPNCHVVIVGADRVAYGRPLSNGQTYKEAMLEKLTLDMSRVHFTGLLPYHQYLQVLQASSVHVYLTRPFVLSWSMLEAMSVGCLLLGSNNQPVTEVIEDGVNGLLVDFFDSEKIAGRIEDVLNNPKDVVTLRSMARKTIIERYDLKKMLSQQVEMLSKLARSYCNR